MHVIWRVTRLEEIRYFFSLKERSKQEYIPPAVFYTVHSGRGDLDQMFYYLEQAYEDRDSWLPWFLSKPKITAQDSLVCSDPRFKAMRKKIGLE